MQVQLIRRFGLGFSPAIGIMIALMGGRGAAHEHLAGTDAVLLALRLHQTDNLLLDLDGVLDALQQRHFVVHAGGIHLHRAQAEEALPQRAADADVTHAVEILLVQRAVQEALLHNQTVLGQHVLGERPREAQEGALPVLPDILHFPHMHSPFCQNPAIIIRRKGLSMHTNSPHHAIRRRYQAAAPLSSTNSRQATTNTVAAILVPSASFASMVLAWFLEK